MAQLLFSQGQPSSSFGAGILFWGADSVGNSGASRFLAPGWDDGTAPTVPRPIVLPRDITVVSIYAIHGTPGGTGATLTYTLRANGAVTPVTVDLATTFSQNSVTGLSVALTAGTVLDLLVTRSGAAGTGSRRPSVGIGFL